MRWFVDGDNLTGALDVYLQYRPNTDTGY